MAVLRAVARGSRPGSDAAVAVDGIKDPLNTPAQLAPYAYGFGNPLVHADPSGLTPIFADQDWRDAMNAPDRGQLTSGRVSAGDAVSYTGRSNPYQIYIYGGGLRSEYDDLIVHLSSASYRRGYEDELARQRTSFNTWRSGAGRDWRPPWQTPPRCDSAWCVTKEIAADASASLKYALREGGKALQREGTEFLKDPAGWTWKNRDNLVSLALAGSCFVPGVGTVGCMVAGGLATGVSYLDCKLTDGQNCERSAAIGAVTVLAPGFTVTGATELFRSGARKPAAEAGVAYAEKGFVRGYVFDPSVYRQGVMRAWRPPNMGGDGNVVGEYMTNQAYNTFGFVVAGGMANGTWK